MQLWAARARAVCMKSLPGSWGLYLSYPAWAGNTHTALVVTLSHAEGLGMLLAPPRTQATSDSFHPVCVGRWARGDLGSGSVAGWTMSLWATQTPRAAPSP